MDNRWDEIVAFCRKHDKVICYGASNYGYTVKHFLARIGIDICAFVVSEKKQTNQCVEDVPVFSLDELVQRNSEIGIILSLTERFHEEVKEKIYRKFGRMIDIYSMNRRLWQDMYTVLVNDKRKYMLLEKTCEYKKIEEYKKRICKIKKKYHRILVQNREFGVLGTMGIWMAWYIKRRENMNDEFWLYYPYTALEQSPQKYLKGDNGCLIKKFKTDGLEVINEENIDFWRFFIKEEPKVFRFDDNLDQFLICNEKFVKHMGQFDENILYIKFSKNECKEGEYNLKSMKITKPYVCISARDSFYINHIRGILKETIIDQYRNSNILTRIKAIKYLRRQNIYTVRMGAGSNQSFRCENVLDYATNNRSEFMDMYLAYQCKFFVGDQSGIHALSALVSKPMVVTNATVLTSRRDLPIFWCVKRDIMIMKKYWNTRKQRYLSIREMLEFEVKTKDCQDDTITSVFGLYNIQGIIAEENTEDEIDEVIREMNERIDGTRQYDDIDNSLQMRFREIVDNYPKDENYVMQCRMGADFLRNNQWLLD